MSFTYDQGYQLPAWMGGQTIEVRNSSNVVQTTFVAAIASAGYPSGGSFSLTVADNAVVRYGLFLNGSKFADFGFDYRTIPALMDSPGTTTLLSRLSATRAGFLDYLDASITSRMVSFTYTTPPTTAQIATALLTTPANKIATDASGRVTVGAIGATAIQAIWEIGLTTVFLAGSMGEKLKLFFAGLGADNKVRLSSQETGSGLSGVASQASVDDLSQYLHDKLTIPDYEGPVVVFPSAGDPDNVVVRVITTDAAGAKLPNTLATLKFSNAKSAFNHRFPTTVTQTATSNNDAEAFFETPKSSAIRPRTSGGTHVLQVGDTKWLLLVPDVASGDADDMIVSG